MKPKRIILVRRGESESNADWGKNETIPDYAIKLTSKGADQARQSGETIKQIIGDETLHVYLSPYARTRET